MYLVTFNCTMWLFRYHELLLSYVCLPELNHSYNLYSVRVGVISMNFESSFLVKLFKYQRRK